MRTARERSVTLSAALDYVQEVNGNGRRLHIHGVNLSLGHSFEPEWFACGQSPLCVEVERLVRSGVVVVVAAGNTGYGSFDLPTGASFSSGMGLSINDPGNADLAITVGSTHRYMPHVYGVSYFSSKGPTGDGRPKPDLVAPGEKIISCATGKLKLGRRSRPGVRLRRDEWDKHGGAARERGHRGIPFHSRRIHRQAGARQRDFHLHGNRPQAGPLFPGSGPR